MSNVDYGKIIKRSWHLTWNNKWLWVPGLVLAAYGGGSSGGSGSGGGSSSSSEMDLPGSTPAPFDIENVRQETTNVLGQATNFFMDWFSGISVGEWILFGLIVLLFILFSVAGMWILTSWAKGALISGLKSADLEESVNLKTFAPKGISKIKDLIIFNLISTGLALGLILAVVLVVGVGFLLKELIPALGIIWIMLFGLVGGLSLVVFFILLTMLSVYAERLIVLQNMSPWAAWKKGLSLSKGNFVPTFLMGLINSIIGCFAGCTSLIALLIVFALPTYILVAPMFSDGFKLPNAGQLMGLIILVLLFFGINTLIRAVMVVFNYGNWNLLFKELVEGGKNE
jgi:hypothetical protein